MDFQKKEVLANGRRVAYWEKNPKARKVLVMLHGLPGNHFVLLKMANQLSGFRIIIPDFPASGESEPLAKPHILKNYSDWLEMFLDELKLKKILLLGFSFGGRVAVTFADKNAQQISKLVLVTPVARFDSLISRLGALEYLVASKLPEKPQRVWVTNRLFGYLNHWVVMKGSDKNRRRELIREDRKEMKNLNVTAVVEVFEELHAAKSLAVGKEISVKTLLIAGDLDQIASLRSIMELARRFPDSELKIIKNGGHIVVGEEAAQVAKLVQDFLK